jgi:hypothetical protein
MQIIFYLKTVRSWNFLPDSTKNCPSINVFKSRLNLNIIYDKPTFVYVGSRLGQIFHARICMGCSALNSDLFRKNTVNSRRCTCGAIETPTHYLLNCPHYNIPRQRHIFSLNLPIPLSTELLLVGSNKLTINQNTEIFLSVQKFILSSKWFTL